MLAGLAELLRWLWLVLRKWIWLLGLLPAALDIASTYIPMFPQVQVPLQWSIGAGCLGIFVSAFLVHLDVKSRLAAYEYQSSLWPMVPPDVLWLDVPWMDVGGKVEAAYCLARCRLALLACGVTEVPD